MVVNSRAHPYLVSRVVAVSLLVGVGCSKENKVSVTDDGSPYEECPAEPPLASDIDHFECGDPPGLPHWENRDGTWFTTSDGANGNTFLDANDVGYDGTKLRCAGGYQSDHAACANGRTGDCAPSSACYGATLSLMLKADGTPYNAAALGYTGLRFMVRNPGADADSLKQVRVAVADVNTHPSGGRCTACFDFFGTMIPVTTLWTLAVLHWRDMTQDGFGDPVTALDPTGVFLIEFQIDPRTSSSLMVDDLGFVND
jgi:hypothetical protein